MCSERRHLKVAPETLALMRKMVASGEADYLVPERVWQEFAKGLMEREPERMFEVLDACSLRKKLLPELRIRESCGFAQFVSAEHRRAAPSKPSDASLVNK